MRSLMAAAVAVFLGTAVGLATSPQAPATTQMPEQAQRPPLDGAVPLEPDSTVPPPEALVAGQTRSWAGSMFIQSLPPGTWFVYVIEPNFPVRCAVRMLKQECVPVALPQGANAAWALVKRKTNGTWQAVMKGRVTLESALDPPQFNVGSGLTFLPGEGLELWVRDVIDLSAGLPWEGNFRVQASGTDE